MVLRGERGTFHIPEAQKHEAAHADDGVDGYTVSKANARLIAAAPDLYEALQALMPLCEEAMTAPRYRSLSQKEAMENAYAATTKAGGKHAE